MTMHDSARFGSIESSNSTGISSITPFAGQTSTHEARTGGDKAQRDGRAGMKVVIQRVRIIRWLYTERSICTDPWTATLR